MNSLICGAGGRGRGAGGRGWALRVGPRMRAGLRPANIRAGLTCMMSCAVHISQRAEKNARAPPQPVTA